MSKPAKPLFSIITSTYNSEIFLPENISSVNAQTHKNYEHIFVDGRSTDRTTGIIKDALAADPNRIKFLSRPPRGISHAMNVGINAASGTYIVILHSDDSFYDNKVLEDAARFLEANPNDD